MDGIGVANGVSLNQTLATSYMAATDETIGVFSPNGTTYSQSNGTNLATNELEVGWGATSAGDGRGTYILSGGTLNVSTAVGPYYAGEFIGFYGSGTVVQSGGTNTVGTAAEFADGIDNPLYLAFAGTSNSTEGVTGNYTLDSNTASTAVLTVYGDEAIGCGDTGNPETNTVTATGSFNQSGNTTNSISGKLSLGDQALGIGSYTLGSGSVVNVGGNEYVGNAGQGTFNQNGGNNNVTGDLYVANQAGSTGSFSMGGGNLSAASETIGNLGSGTFIQNGGSNTVGMAGYSLGMLTIGAGSSYTLNNSSSTLVVNGALSVAGGGSFALSGGSLTVGSETVGERFSAGDPYSPATFNQTGGTHTIGSPTTPGSLIIGNSTYAFGTTGTPVGNEYIEGPSSQLTVNGNEIIGYIGVAEINETSPGEFFIASSTDNFSQIGGIHQVSADLYLGYGASTTGSFELGLGGSSASLSVSGNEYIGYQNVTTQGYAGDGSLYTIVAPPSTFTQNANTSHSVAGTLSIGDQAGSSGSYTLSAGGVLNVGGDENVGNAGQGAFIQNGGTNNITGNLYVANQYGSSGSFSLAGGSLSAASENIGNKGAFGSDAFIQNGGTNTVGTAGSGLGNLTIGAGSSYTLNNSSSTLVVNGNASVTGGGSFTFGSGSMTAASEGVGETPNGGYSNSPGTFNQTGGTQTIGSSTLPGGLIIGNTGDSTGFGLEGPGSGNQYSLSGTGSQLTVNGDESIGYSDYPTSHANSPVDSFTQSGGTHQINGTLYLGQARFAAGAFALGGGSLTAENEVVGNYGSGTFTQNGGTNNISGGVLTLVAQYGATGSYTLSGSASTTLTAGSEQIGPTGSPATFVQQGGVNTVVGGIPNTIDFNVGYNSSYALSGGTLNLTTTGNSFNDGLFVLSGTGVLNGYLINSQTANQNTDGTYSSGLVINGGTVTAASTLFNEFGAVMNGGSVEGTIVDQETTTFTQSGGTVSGTINNYGNYYLQGSGNITGGTLNNWGLGMFLQNAGTVTGIASTSGTYYLQGGTYSASAPAGSAAVLPEGSFQQSGGTINTPTFLNQGYYGMGGGTFSSTSTLVNDSYFSYAGGSFNGSLENYGTALIGGLALNVGNGIVNDGTVSIEIETSVTLSGAIGLDNIGAVTMGEASTLTGNILNDYGGVFSESGTDTITGNFTNWGTLEIDPTLIVTGAVNNTGLISLGSGELLNAQGGFTNSGDLELGQGARLTGGAVVNNPGGEIVFGQATSTTVYGYSQSMNNAGGVIVINSDNLVTFSNFTGGNNAGGDIQIANNSTLTSGTAFPNSGTMELEGPNSALNGGAITNSGSITGVGRISNPVLNSGEVEAEGGLLQISGAGSTDLAGGQIIADPTSTIQFTQGLAANAGTIVLNGGTFDNNNRPMTNTGIINGDGTFRTGGTGLNNSSGGVIDVTAGTSFYGAVTNSGAMDLYGSTNTFYGNVTNAVGGTIKVTNGSVYFLGNTGASVSGLYTSDPSDNYFNGLAITNTGTVTGGSGDQFSMVSGTTMTNAGKFINGGLLSANAISNSGTFTQTGTLNESSNFTNSGTATIGGSQNSAHGTTLTNTAGITTLQSDAGSAAAYDLSVDVTGGTVALGSPQHWAGLSIIGNGTVDVANNQINLTYGSSDPISSIAGYIASGFNGGAWNGPGIISSSAQTLTKGLRYGVGWADGADGVVSGLSSGQIELKYTLLGDANLDGTVNGSDFSILAANFGLGNTNWDQGNFLYGSSVNGSDFSALAANFGQGDSGADAVVTPADIAALDSFAIANGLPLPTFAAVPEPASAALLLVAASGLFLPRRRR